MKIAVLVLVLCAALCDAHRGRVRDDRSDRPGTHHRGPPPPPYLDEVTEEARREYFDIVSSTDKTIAAQKQEILEWGQKYGIQDKVKEFNEKRESIGNEMKQNVTKLIAALPSALQEFSAIRENEDQTRSQQEEALEKLKELKVCVSISTFTYFRCTTFSDSSSTSSSLDTLTASRVIKDSAVAEVGSRIPCSYMWSRFMNDEFIGKSGEVGGEDAIGRPYGRSGFGRFGERRGFGGFQGHLTCFVLRKLPHYDAK
ncbi:unnamed protein product [Heligmosomoides polygyrus]|uniref:DUF148 domain-containing protein n=1 Tax=Heligmosomoides polygyrus TaxID=6339 RepID=A0A183GXB0_HELPZ|nr:unnamed protein product [Heligmosomoides polygyrus]